MQVRFVNAIALDDNRSNTQCAIDAGYSEASAHTQAYQNLQLPQIQEAIEKRKRQLAADAGVDRASVRYGIADLVRKKACRYCYGVNHEYQWTEAQFTRELSRALAAGGTPPDPQGGFGYSKSREPFPECPECDGEGCEAIKIADGLKGQELLARTAGVFVERQEISGPGGSPMQVDTTKEPSDMTDEELIYVMRLGKAQEERLLGVDTGVSEKALPVTIDAKRLKD